MESQYFEGIYSGLASAIYIHCPVDSVTAIKQVSDRLPEKELTRCPGVTWQLKVSTHLLLV